MTKSPPPTDWERVEAAMRRSIRGVMQPGDAELFDAAFAVDPVEYSRRHGRVRKEVFDEEMAKWRR